MKPQASLTGDAVISSKREHPQSKARHATPQMEHLHCPHFFMQSAPPLAFQAHRMSTSALISLSLATLPFPSNPVLYTASPGYSSFWSNSHQIWFGLVFFKL